MKLGGGGGGGWRGINKMDDHIETSAAVSKINKAGTLFTVPSRVRLIKLGKPFTTFRQSGRIDSTHS